MRIEAPASPPWVLICGLPCSGNHLLERLLRHHGIEAQVWHHLPMDAGLRSEWEAGGGPSAALVPVRAPRIQRASWEKRRERDVSAGHATNIRERGLWTRAEQVRVHADLRRSLRCPAFPVTYRAIVERPEIWGPKLVRFCGGSWRGWPEPVTDGDARYNQIGTEPRTPDPGLCFEDAALASGTDKVTAHDYAPVYQAFLGGWRRDRPLVLFEVGVAQGLSMALWEEYLPLADVHGFDNDHKGKAVMGPNVHRVDVTDQRFPALVATLPRPDVVVDDGGHHRSEKRAAFEALWPRLAPGGVYVIEDLAARDPAKSYAGVIGNRVVDLLTNNGALEVAAIHAYPEIAVLEKA